MATNMIDSTVGGIGKAADELRKRGLRDNEPVKILVGKPSLAELAARMRGAAVEKGLTTEIFDKIIAER